MDERQVPMFFFFSGAFLLFIVLIRIQKHLAYNDMVSMGVFVAKKVGI